MNKLILIIVLSNLILLINSKGILDYSHDEGSQLIIQAGKLSSFAGIIPYSYSRLKICSTEKVKKAEDTIGEILTGEVLFNTGYLAYTNKDSFCQTLCINNFDEKTIKLQKSLIKQKYFINWYLDKLPAGLVIKGNKDSNTKPTPGDKINYSTGIPIGYMEGDKYYVNNHLEFHIAINKAQSSIIGGVFEGDANAPKKFDIVGFSVYPMSVKHSDTSPLCSKEKGLLYDIINKENVMPQELDGSNIIYTYDVVFENSEISMASRWDHYKPSKKMVHWVGIIIAESTIVIITLGITFFFIRSIRKNIELYNYKIASLEKVEDFTWKDLSGDIFRPPSSSPTLLSCLIGSGFQLFFMLAITLFLGTIGFLNPEKRTRMLTMGIAFFCIMGLPGGYIAARFNKLLGGTNWLVNAILTSMIYPGLVVSGYLIVNIILTVKRSSAAVRIVDIISLFILWTFCTFPMILIGSFFGIKRRTIQVPCRTNIVPTLVPPKPFYLHYWFIAIFTGLICFGTIFAEIYYVMAAIWRHQIYFIATFLWVTVLILVIVSGELSVFAVYLNISKGDYNWWWKSFCIGGSPVFYFILYSIYYFFSLKIKTIPAMAVYFGMTGLISSMFVLVCGSISTIMSFLFLKVIYSRVKFD